MIIADIMREKTDTNFDLFLVPRARFIFDMIKPVNENKDVIDITEMKAIEDVTNPVLRTTDSKTDNPASKYMARIYESET